jgi:peroxiredoxin 2/4
MFEKRNTQIIGINPGNIQSHLAWILSIEKATGVRVPFPIISDRGGEVARLFGMSTPDVSLPRTMRSLFIIDDKQIIRSALFYPRETGRNTAEILRLVTALQTADKEKVSTPANWVPGKPLVLPAPKTYEEIKERLCDESLECIEWYLCNKPKI